MGFIKFRPDGSRHTPDKEANASQALVDLAVETWRLERSVRRAVPGMDPIEADRFLNQFEWYLRKVNAVLSENGLRAVDLTGEEYTVGQAVTPLNLEDFPEGMPLRFRIAQMADPIVMENGRVRKTGTVLLEAETEEG